MPSTYTLNNGIELIATGEQSGTWGDTTNTNLSLVDTALDGQVTVTLPSAGTSGSPNTLAISDGAASDGRNRMVIFNDGGDLGATAYVQLTPNDAEKIIYVRNDLAGSRSIILFQGTYNASNDYEVPAGTTAVIYFDGAGSGAVAANVFNNAYFDSLRLGSVSVDKILDEDNMASDDASALATQQSIKAYVDSQVTAQDLDFGGDSGTGAVDLDSQTFTIAGTTNEIETSASGQTLTIGLPNSVTIATATVTGDLTVDTNTLYVDSSNNFVGVGTASPSNKLGLGLTSGATTRLLGEYGNNESPTFEMGVGQGTSFRGGMRIAVTDTGAGIVGDSVVSFHTTKDGGGTVERVTIDEDGNVGIGTTSPASLIHANNTSGDATIRITSSDTGYAQLFLGDQTSGSQGRLEYFNNNNSMGFYTSGAEAMRIDSSGNVGIGTSSIDAKLHVERSVYGGYNALQLENSNGNFGVVNYVDLHMLAGGSTGKVILRMENSSGSGVTDGELAIHTTSSGTTSEAMRIDSSGNVGIGTTSPAVLSHVAAGYTAPTGGLDAGIRSLVSSTGYTGLGILSASNASAYVHFGDPDDSDVGGIIYDHSFNHMQFNVNGTERMRIDSSGNLLVGKTTTSFSTEGALVKAGGHFVKDGNSALYLSRRSSDGSILALYKDSTEVGGIGTAGGDLWIGSSAASHAAVRFANGAMFPVSNTGGSSNGLVDIGDSLARFKDLYLSGGVYLGGTGSANLLDDVEEGTFIPHLYVGSTKQSLSRENGYYSKVGNLVNVSIGIILSGAVSGSGAVELRNFPYNSKGGGASGGVNARSAGSIGYTDATFMPVGILMGANTSTAVFYKNSVAGTTGTAMSTALQGSDLISNFNIHLSLTYNVT